MNYGHGLLSNGAQSGNSDAHDVMVSGGGGGGSGSSSRDELVFRINRRDIEGMHQQPMGSGSQDPCKRALCELFCSLSQWKDEGDAPGVVKRQKRMSRQNWEDAYVMRTTGRHIPTKTKERYDIYAYLAYIHT
jgi:hypothetical protein